MESDADEAAVSTEFVTQTPPRLDHDPLGLLIQLRTSLAFTNDQAEMLFLQLENSIRVLLSTLSSQYNDVRRLERTVEKAEHALREVINDLQL